MPLRLARWRVRAGLARRAAGSASAPGRHEHHAAKEWPAIEARSLAMAATLDSEHPNPYSAVGHDLAPSGLPRDAIAGGVRLQGHFTIGSEFTLTRSSSADSTGQSRAFASRLS